MRPRGTNLSPVGLRRVVCPFVYPNSVFPGAQRFGVNMKLRKAIKKKSTGGPTGMFGLAHVIFLIW